MVNKLLLLTIALFIFLFQSCVDMKDTFNSKELVSSMGEKIYINSLNYGMTDDNQYTIISKDSNKLKERADTANSIKGIIPFIYRFEKDILYLFYLKEKDIVVRDCFESIKISYNPLENRDYINLINKTGKGEGGYQLVP